MAKMNFVVLLVVLFAFAAIIAFHTADAVPQCNEVCGRPEEQQHACCRANGYYAGIGCRDGQMFCGPPL